MAENRAVQVEERNPHVAHGPDSFRISFEREKIDDPIWIVNQALAVDHDLTRCAVDVVLPVIDPIAVQPESERPQTARLREVLRHPRAVGPQGASQVLDEGHEKALARFAGRALENHPQRSVPGRLHAATVLRLPFAANTCVLLGAVDRHRSQHKPRRGRRPLAGLGCALLPPNQLEVVDGRRVAGLEVQGALDEEFGRVEVSLESENMMEAL